MPVPGFAEEADGVHCGETFPRRDEVIADRSRTRNTRKEEIELTPVYEPESLGAVPTTSRKHHVRMTLEFCAAVSFRTATISSLLLS